MFYNLHLGHYTVQSSTRAPLPAPDISVPRVIQDHKNIFMRASGYWATEMFAIFSGLYYSIRASRLILRAPTVSPSIRNMYNSAVCFFPLFFFQTYTCAITRPQQPRLPKKRKRKKTGHLLGGWSVRKGVGEITRVFPHSVTVRFAKKNNK